MRCKLSSCWLSCFDEVITTVGKLRAFMLSNSALQIGESVCKVARAVGPAGICRREEWIFFVGMTNALADLSAVVHSHCLFFDKLVELIPPKFYIPNEEANDSWTYKKNKAARLAAKIVTRENLKKAKRNRLDPDKFKSTLQLLQEKNAEQEKEPHQSNEAAGLENKKAFKAPVNVDRAVTYVELRERLHKRIEMLRTKRHAETGAAAMQSARTFQNEKKKETLKRRLSKASPKEQAVPKEVASEEQPPKRQKKVPDVVKKDPKKDLEIEQTQLEFGRVTMGIDSTMAGPIRKRRKDTKEDLLRKAKELQENMQDPQKGQEVISKHSWTSAVSRAAGEKVLDNPKLIKNSMKREKQQKEKSAKKWKERKGYENKASAEKQNSRKENISQRIQSNKDRAIAKREKKLMRPGFEGRKAGFINS